MNTFEVKPISRISRSASRAPCAGSRKPNQRCDLAAHEDVADDRLLDGERAVLEHGLDAGIARARGVPMGLDLAAHENLAAGRLDRAGEHLDQCRLARAIVAEQADDLAAVDMEIDAADGEDPAVGFRDVPAAR